MEKKCYWAKHSNKQSELERVKEAKAEVRRKLEALTSTQFDPLKEKEQEATELYESFVTESVIFLLLPIFFKAL